MYDEPSLAKIAEYLQQREDPDLLPDAVSGVDLPPGIPALPRAVLLVFAVASPDRIRQFVTYAMAHGRQIVGWTRSLSAAAKMVETGEAEVILVESRSDLPARLESVTYGDITQSEVHVPQRRGRPRRLRRGRRNGAG